MRLYVCNDFAVLSQFDGPLAVDDRAKDLPGVSSQLGHRHFHTCKNATFSAFFKSKNML